MHKTRTASAICLTTLSLLRFTACTVQPAIHETKPEVKSAQNAHAEPAKDQSTPEITPEPTLEPAPEPTAFTIAWMSDTQAYTAADSDVFGRMTQWIVDTRQEYNTVMTVHTGDIVYNAFREYEWQNSVAAFAKLPKDMHILTAAGNHDQLPEDQKETPYLDHRPDTDFDPARAFDKTGLSYYMTFEAGGVPILVFSLAYGQEVEAASWVNEVCKQYADHYAILCLHNYMDLGGYSSVGRRLIKSVIQQSPNIRVVLCGHERGMQYFAETPDDNKDATPDRTVHQMMMNVQDDAERGVGYLRLLRFDPVLDTIEVVTYSPVLDCYGYKVPVGGDRFGGKKTLENAGLRDFLTQVNP